MPTALEIAQGRNTPLTAGLLMAVQTRAPAVAAFDARTTPDKTFNTLSVTALPSSAFVNHNEGFPASRGTLALRSFDCSLIGGQIREAVETAREWNRTHPNVGYTYFDLQAQLKMMADTRHIEKQMFYGTSNDAKGFPGMKELTPYVAANVLALTASPDDTDFVKSVINAGGTTATTASSVYSVVYGEIDGCQLVLGNDQGGELFQLGEIIQQAIAPDSNAPNNLLMHNIAEMIGYVGLSVSGMNQTPNSVVPVQYALRRLANVTADSGCTVTDSKLEKLALAHGDGIRPNAFYMSPRSGDQLATSRSATSVTLFLGGMPKAKDSVASLQAPRPDNYEGIPIVYTSAIRNVDAIES